MTAMARKWFKRLVLVLAIIPMLIFLAFLGAINFIDFNGYKPQIEKEVSDYTGRNFKIEGSIDVSVMPFVFSVGKSSLAQPQGFDPETPQFSMKSVEVELSMWSLLLHKKLEILSVELVGPTLNLQRNADGQDNWSDLPALSNLLPLLPAQQQVSDNGVQPLPLNAFFTPNASAQSDTDVWSLQSLVISDGCINLSEQQENYRMNLEKVNLFALNLQANKPFEVRSDFQYHHSLSPRTVNFRITSNFEMDQKLQNYLFSDWQGVVTVSLPEEFAVPQAHLTTSGSAMKIDLAQKRVQMEQLNLEGLNGKLQTNFSGRFGAALDITGELKAKEIDLPLWSKHLALPLAQKDDPKWQKVNGEFRWSWVGEEILIEPYLPEPSTASES